MQRNYIRAIELFLISNDKFAKKKIFEFIDMAFIELQDPKFRNQIQSLLNFILKIIKDLVLIDAEKSRMILEKYEEKDQHEALENLNDFPEMKFKLLKKMSNKHEGLLIQYFELLCQINPEEAVNELMKGIYPQDECLKICQKYKINQGSAYLLERSGQVEEAINIYFDIFIQNLKGLLQSQNELLYLQDKNENIIRFIMEQLQNAINISRTNSKRNDDESDANWFLLLVRMTKLRQDLYFMKDGKGQGILKCLNYVYTQLLEEIVSRIQIKNLISNLDQTLRFFSATEMKDTITKLLWGFSYERQLLSQSMTVIREGCIIGLFELYSLKHEGRLILQRCYECYERWDGGRNIIGFNNCQHAYHDGCIGIAMCLKCDRIKNSVQRVSLRMKLNQQKMERKEEKVSDSKRQIRLEKLRQFDQIKQFE